MKDWLTSFLMHYVCIGWVTRYPSGHLLFISFSGKHVEIKHTTYRAIKELKLSLNTTRKHRLLQLQDLHELRHNTYENEEIYKENTKAFHDRHIRRKNLQVNDKVSLYNSHLKLFPRKVRS